MKILSIALAFATISMSYPVVATELADTPSAATQALKGVRPPELPAMAAKLVRQSAADTRLLTTIQVIQSAHQCNTAAMLSVVGAISRATPDMAATAAATAAAQQPRLAWAFARTAALAAPEHAGDVVLATAKAVPASRIEIATAVAQAAPKASESVLEALSKSDPRLDPFLAEARWYAQRHALSAPSIIAYANQRANEQPRLRIAPDAEVSPPGNPPGNSGNKPPNTPPQIGPPFENPPGNPSHTVPGPPFDIPPGWMRKYSHPGPPSFPPGPPPNVPPGPPNPVPPGHAQSH